jgi:hypothetical protein
MSTAFIRRMTLDISWTRRAMRLPPEVRAELAGRLERLNEFFPEMKKKMKIGITRFYDGLVWQSDSGYVKLMIDVHRSRKDGWKYPTNWTIAHELMHLAQFNSCGIPSGERATDIYALSRLPPRFIDESPTYLVVPDGPREAWKSEHAKLAHDLAVKAITLRNKGLKNYAVWWETEFEKVFDS